MISSTFWSISWQSLKITKICFCREMPARVAERCLLADRNNHYCSPAKPKASAGWLRKRKSGQARRRPGRPRRRSLTAASRSACWCLSWTNGATGRTNVSTGGVVCQFGPPDAGCCPRPSWCTRASQLAPKFCAAIRQRACSSTNGSYISAWRRDCPTMPWCINALS